MTKLGITARAAPIGALVVLACAYPFVEGIFHKVSWVAFILLLSIALAAQWRLLYALCKTVSSLDDDCRRWITQREEQETREPPPGPNQKLQPGSESKKSGTQHQASGTTPPVRPGIGSAYSAEEVENPEESLRRTRDAMAREEESGRSSHHGHRVGHPLARASEPNLSGRPSTSPASGGLQGSEVAAAWNEYLARGNGLFDSSGLSQALEGAGLRAEVLQPDNLVGFGTPVLGIAEQGRRERIYLVPDFTRSPQAVTDWFKLDPGMPRTARARRLIRPAELKREGSQYKLVTEGILE